jgi:PD-(D/E)XK nuclease superfamily protein
VALHSGAFLHHALDTLQSGSLQQLWLDHLLVLAVQRADTLDSALFVLAYPEINERCREAALAYGATLDASRAPTFEARTLEEIVAVLEDSADAGWASEFRERYLTPTG